MYKLSILDKLSFLLVVIGGLNYGLIGLLDFNLVNFLTGGIAIVQRIIYIIVFLSSINLIYLIIRCSFSLKNN